MGRAETRQAQGWSQERIQDWVQEAWRGCWRRMFGVEPPPDLFPPYPTTPDLKAAVREWWRIPARGQ